MSRAGISWRSCAAGKIATESVRATASRPTTHKTRVCAITRQLHDHLDIEDQQQIVRVDHESRAPLDATSKAWLFDRLRAEIATHDAIILEDYAKGLIDQELVTLVITEAKRRGKIVAIDPQPEQSVRLVGRDGAEAEPQGSVPVRGYAVLDR